MSRPRRNTRVYSRQQRRRQVSRALWNGFIGQLFLTGVLAGVLALFRIRLAGLQGLPLFWVSLGVLAVPACAAFFVAGYLAPFVRWWQLLGVSALATLVILGLGFPVPDARALPGFLKLYLVVPLLLCAAGAGLLGHWRRACEEAEDAALEPRPWGSRG